MTRDTKNIFSELRSSFIKRAVQRYLINTVLLALFLCVSALAIQRFTILQWTGFWFYPLLIIIAAALSLLYGVRIERGFKDEIMRLEQRLNLKELLSTWHELRQSEPENPWTEKLETETRNFFKKIPPQKAFPRPFNRVHLLVPVFFLLFIFLLVINPLDFKAEEPLDRSLVQLGTRLERIIKQMTLEEQRPKEALDREITEEIEKLAEALKIQKLKKEKLLQIVNEMKLKIEKDNNLLSRQIEEELGVGDISDKPSSGQEKNIERKSEKLDRLKEQLEEVFKKEVPVTLSKRVQSLRRSLELEELLDEVSDEMGAGYAFLGQEDSQEGLGEAGEETSSKKERDEDFKGQSIASKDQKITTDRKRDNDIDAPGREGLDNKGGDVPEEEPLDIFQAGRGTSSEKSDTPGDFNRKRGPILTERHDIEPEDPLIIQVKSLPIMQQIEIKPEDIIKNYRRELEAVLNKEDIPINDRETIRNYFLSIGLRKEKNDTENY